MQDAEREFTLCTRGAERFFDLLECLFGIFQVKNIHRSERIAPSR